MKTILLISALVIGLIQCVLGQYDPKAREVLDAMSNKYQSIPSFKASITHTLENQQENLNEEFSGDITVKGDMYRLDMGGQEVINNGVTLWTYLEDVNEVNIADYDPEDEELSPSKIYDLYKTGYKYILIEELPNQGDSYDIVDLIPEDKDNQFFKIRMVISKKEHTLKSWQMFDKTGNVYTYQITDFNPNLDISDSFFVFDASAYEGVEVIDFR
ncbi:MAG: outer membrane lipoprotein carrier protein LolA [Bacteroidetes bacterium]|nr:outer membrane lipoprotein carrier protein LolA [Bacteroidota bacterium]